MVINPVIERELKTKMRKWRAPALLGFYLSALILVFFTMTQTYNSNMYGPYNTFAPSMITDIFSTLAIIQLGLILLIVPSITSTSINGERERQTLDLMLCTDFSTYSILNGKIVVSMLHIIYLIIAALPVFGIAFLYGGVDFMDLFKLVVFYLSTATMFGAAGTFFSSCFRKTRVSSIVTYIFIIISVVGTFIICALVMNVYSRMAFRNIHGGIDANAAIENFMYLNPFYALGNILPMGNNGILGNVLSMQIYGSIINKSVYLTSFAKNLYYNTAMTLIFYFLASESLKPVQKHLFRK